MDSENESVADKWMRRIKNNPLLAILVVGSACLGGIVSAIKNWDELVTLINGHHPPPNPFVLPIDTGWVLCGYFDRSVAVYIDGGSCVIAKSHYPDKNLLPRVGDQIRITKERNLVINNYSTKGTTEINAPPWTRNILEPSDFTGIKIPVGAELPVRDVNLGHFEGRPEAVWVRVGAR